MRQLFATAVALTLAAVVGCGSSKIVPVSGVVKLNGNPYKNAVVSLQPLGTKDNPEPGRGSMDVTDENGRFTLKYDGEKPGALVGKHRLRIFTEHRAARRNDDLGESARGENPFEPIPAEWNENSTKQFEVPPGGTDAVEFDIWTKAGLANKK